MFGGGTRRARFANKRPPSLHQRRILIESIYVTEHNMASHPNDDESIIADVKEKIRSGLKDLDCAGSFASFGTIEDLADPYIRVDGLGHIKVPLTEESAQSLVGKHRVQTLHRTLLFL